MLPILEEILSPQVSDLEKEKLLCLGLYLKERGSFNLLRLLEEDLRQRIKNFTYSEKELFALAEEELKRAKKLAIKILYWKEKDYPEVLRKIPYKPPFLYLKGKLPEGRPLAVIGTRKPSPYGKEVVERFIPRFIKAGLITVSGLARGIDTLVHALTLKEGGATVAVLGTGLDVIYPPENHKLAEKIVEAGSALISEFSLGTKPRKENFPRRNRLISGLSEAVLIVEAGERSGTMITAKWAQDQGKDVFVVPGNIFSEYSKGTNFLLKNGAIPVTCPEDVLYHLGISEEIAERQRPLLNLQEHPLSMEERKILEILRAYPLHLEEIINQVDLELPSLLALLTDLELKGLIKSLPGKFFQLL